MSSESRSLDIDVVAEHLFDTVLNSCILEECFNGNVIPQLRRARVTSINKLLARKIQLHRERAFLKAGRGDARLSPEPPLIKDPAVILQQQSQVHRAKQLDCKCPICSRKFAATRFAPHLEKCFGIGRRAARRPVQNYNADSRPSSVHSMSEDACAPRSDSDEDDWGPKKKKRKPKKKK